MDRFLVDKRLIERNVDSGCLTSKEYKKYLDELPDLTDMCEPVETLLYEKDEEKEAVLECEKSAEDILEVKEATQ